jgi:ABC-2 type transport system permease protein
MFFTSSALCPLWKLREGGAEAVYFAAVINPFTSAVELCRFALYGMFDWMSAAVVIACAAVFFVIAAIGYDPQRGMIRRAKGPAAG